jgi:hypothetical protein
MNIPKTISSTITPIRKATLLNIMPITREVMFKVNACAIIPILKPFSGYLSVMLFQGDKNVRIRNINENISLNVDT